MKAPVCATCGGPQRRINNASTKRGYSFACQPCTSLRSSEWRKNNPDRQRQLTREWRKANPDKTRGYLLSRYSLTSEGYDELLAAQGGGCAVCHKPPTAGVNLAIDHDHTCCPPNKSCGGCVRGLLCVMCNKALGHVYDDPQILHSLIQYLERPLHRAASNQPMIKDRLAGRTNVPDVPQEEDTDE